MVGKFGLQLWPPLPRPCMCLTLDNTRDKKTLWALYAVSRLPVHGGKGTCNTYNSKTSMQAACLCNKWPSVNGRARYGRQNALDGTPLQNTQLRHSTRDTLVIFSRLPAPWPMSAGPKTSGASVAPIPGSRLTPASTPDSARAVGSRPASPALWSHCCWTQDLLLEYTATQGLF